MRFEEKAVCKECRELNINCADSKKCLPIRQPLRNYTGIRCTADGFDCALPVTIDSHSSCSYQCLYCFSDNILGHSVLSARESLPGQTSLRKLENIFKDKTLQEKAHWHIKKALKYDNRNKDGYPCAVQLGGLCDPCDSIEQNQGWLLDFLDIAIKYEQPVRISTKGVIFMIPEYLEKLKKAPHLFWVAFSTITDDDEVMKRVDRFAPTASQRIECVKKLTEIGVKTSLRLRPMIVGITDRDGAYKRLINKFADAGSRAISYEIGFFPSTVPGKDKWKWERLSKISGHDLKGIYGSFGKMQSCTRPSYLWAENIMHSVKEIAHSRGMTCGVSDPVWKQLSDVGCCCGIKPEDPVFGNWEREGATNALVNARDGKNKGLIRLADITPEWAKTMCSVGMVNPGAGPKAVARRYHETWADILKDTWNRVGKERSPMNYFQGALQLAGFDEEGNRVYKYVGLKRQNKESHWNIVE